MSGLQNGLCLIHSQCVTLSISHARHKLSKLYTLFCVILYHVKEAKWVTLTNYMKWGKHAQHTTVYPNKYAHGFVVLCFVAVMQSFIMNSHEVFIQIHQGCFAGTGAIVRLPQCQWSKPDGYGKISQCITTTKRSKAKTVCIFLGIYCTPKANSVLELLHRNIHHCSETLCEQAFIYIVHPWLENSTAVWEPYLAHDVKKNICGQNYPRRMDKCLYSIPYINYFILNNSIDNHWRYPAEDNQCPKKAGHHTSSLPHQANTKRQFKMFPRNFD